MILLNKKIEIDDQILIFFHCQLTSEKQIYSESESDEEDEDNSMADTVSSPLEMKV